MDRVFSFYSEMPESVLRAQFDVFGEFGVELEQVPFDIPKGRGKSSAYGRAIDGVLRACSNDDVVAIFDVDCIPLDEDSVPFLFGRANECVLVGCSQQANHFEKSSPYASPACMAIRMSVFSRIGSPSFVPPARGDVGEAVTMAARGEGVPVFLLAPTSVEVPKWKVGESSFGLGTTYGLAPGYPDMFYHSFQSRGSPRRFLRKCKEVLSELSKEEH